MKSIGTLTIVIAVGLIVQGCWSLLTQVESIVHADFTSLDISFLLVPVGVGLFLKGPQSFRAPMVACWAT